MGFLNNSGDIILDAVLTDEGRARLARGDGSFRIVKFALGDDEINYNLFNASAVTALQTLAIEQTPILEAFTNNAASMKSKLITVGGTNRKYLAIIKPNTSAVADPAGFAGKPFASVLVSNGYVYAADTTTFSELSKTTGYYNSANIASSVIDANAGAILKFDQGIDNKNATTISGDLIENQYIVEIDSRLASVMDSSNVMASPYIDDDLIATYFFSKETNPIYVYNNTAVNDQNNNVPTSQVIQGPRGTSFKFKLSPSTSITSNNYLFDTIGSSVTGFASGTWKAIRSTITVYGATTGYTVIIPIMFLKKTA
jgi:hypothetical protein